MTGTLEHLDPATLLIRDNVRDDAVLDKQFVASVREHGVLQPITAIRTEGGIEVRDGQRRTLAAREAHLASIPVYVLDAAIDNATAAAAERIAVQIVANDQRTALTDAQRAKASPRCCWPESRRPRSPRSSRSAATRSTRRPLSPNRLPPSAPWSPDSSA